MMKKKETHRTTTRHPHEPRDLGSAPQTGHMHVAPPVPKAPLRLFFGHRIFDHELVLVTAHHPVGMFPLVPNIDKNHCEHITNFEETNSEFCK